MFGLKLIKVKGHSMEPAIKAGSFVLINTWVKNFKVGDVIYFEHGKPMLKRIANIDNDLIQVEGDNQTDSLKISPIKKDQITGKAIWS